MSEGKYILEGHTPVPCHDLMGWALWFESADRKVAVDHVGDSKISTVFLGVDHAWGANGPPQLFETMVFGGPMDMHQERCSTWDEAVRQHDRVLEQVRQNQYVNPLKQ